MTDEQFPGVCVLYEICGTLSEAILHLDVDTNEDRLTVFFKTETEFVVLQQHIETFLNSIKEKLLSN